jgi:hypothetical protein
MKLTVPVDGIVHQEMSKMPIVLLKVENNIELNSLHDLLNQLGDD